MEIKVIQVVNEFNSKIQIILLFLFVHLMENFCSSAVSVTGAL